MMLGKGALYTCPAYAVPGDTPPAQRYMHFFYGYANAPTQRIDHGISARMWNWARADRPKGLVPCHRLARPPVGPAEMVFTAEVWFHRAGQVVYQTPTLATGAWNPPYEDLPSYINQGGAWANYANSHPPAPGSRHPGGVVFSYCDGHVRVISRNDCRANLGKPGFITP